jgi:hypothetical protein
MTGDPQFHVAVRAVSDGTVTFEYFTLSEERGALLLLNCKTRGHFESFLLARGFTKETLDALLAKGFATAKTELIYSDATRVEALRLTITSAGRQAIGSI